MSYLAGPRSRVALNIILLGFLAAGRLPAQEPIKTLSLANPGPMRIALEFSADGKAIATGREGGVVRLWNVSTGKEIRAFTGHFGDVFCVAFTPDGKALAVGSGKLGEIKYEFGLSGVKTTKIPGAGEIKVWELSSGKELKTLKFDGCDVRELVFAKEGNVLMSGRADGKVDWWEEPPTMLRIKTETNPFGEHGRVVISRAGKVIFLAPERGAMRIFDREKNEKWFCPQPGYIVSVAPTPDGRLVAVGTTEIKVWNVGTGKAEAALGGFKVGVFALAFSPDGKILAAGRATGEITLWDVTAKKELATMAFHKGAVTCLAFSPDGKLLASGGDDGTVNLWRVPGPDKIDGPKGKAAPKEE